MTHQTFSPRAGVTLAYHKTEARADVSLPGVIFCGGFKSDMTGGKATHLEAQCRARGQAYVRFDYTGHGISSGRFIDGNIGSWFQDALDVFDAHTTGPQVIVGSSMGGWIALLLALARQDRTHALIGLAPAPDFTEDVYWHEFTDADRHRLETDGIIHRPSDYGEPYPLTKQLFDDGRKHLLLTGKIHLPCPVRLIHGKHDDAVPWQKSEHILAQLVSPDARILWVDDGDHRLSRDQDLKLIDDTVQALST